jgi:hypothetical protein
MYTYSPADEDSTVFHLQLNCTSRKSTDSKILSLSSFPSSTLELKQAIESRFSIPVCVQSVSYQLAPLSDEDSLLERRIRSGDTLSVSYLCEADCQLIREVIEWLKNVTAAIQIEHLTEEGGANTDDIFRTGCFEAEYPILLHKSFRWLDPKCYANKLYFEAMGGLQAVIELYRYEDSGVVALSDYSILLPLVRACAAGGKAIGLSVVSTKIARSRHLGISAICKYNESIELGEKLASVWGSRSLQNFVAISTRYY